METPGDIRAVIYVPDTSETDRWYRTALEYCEAHRYEVVGVVTERCAGDCWVDVIEMLRTGEANIAVIGRRDHLPAQRSPRIEVIAEATTPRAPTTRHRRPRAIT
jgi:hypothetical protein